MHPIYRIPGGELSLDVPRVMGVVNLTPDSFSDGGRRSTLNAVLDRCRAMERDGADIIDLGAESTRPGADPVSAEAQVERLLPVLSRLRAESDILISIDTGEPAVMRAAAEAGANIINDVYGLRAPGALDAVAETGLAVVLMHMQGLPATMQDDPRYEALPEDLIAYFEGRIEACVAAGIDEQRIAIDPGFGFGKTDPHNLRVLSRLGQFGALGRPVVVGLSRKSLLGRLTGRDVDARVPAGLAAATIACLRGAHIVRTHDVPETVDALRIVAAVQAADSQ